MMVLDSVTYRFAWDREDDWPLNIHKEHTKAQFYRPDHLSFTVHVTGRGRITWLGMQVSGFRILKDGSKSTHRIHETLYANPEESWFRRYVHEALGYVRDRHPVEG
jgi:hypothetical protein